MPQLVLENEDNYEFFTLCGGLGTIQNAERFLGFFFFPRISHIRKTFAAPWAVISPFQRNWAGTSPRYEPVLPLCQLPETIYVLQVARIFNEAML